MTGTSMMGKLTKRQRKFHGNGNFSKMYSISKTLLLLLLLITIRCATRRQKLRKLSLWMNASQAVLMTLEKEHLKDHQGSMMTIMTLFVLSLIFQIEMFIINMLICRRHPVPPPRLDSYHISGSRDRGPSSLNSRSGSGRRVRCAQSRDGNDDDVHKNIKCFRSGSGSEIFDRLPDSGSNVYHQDCRQLVYNTHSWMIFSLLFNCME